MDDLTLIPAAELHARLDAITTETDRRARVASLTALIAHAEAELRREAALLPHVTITSVTVTPEQGWLPGQIVQQGGKQYRQTLPVPTDVRPGGTIRPWVEHTEPKPEVEDVPETDE